MEFVRSDHQEQSRVSVQRLLNRALAGVRPESEAREITLEVDPAPSELMIEGWEVRLEHALVNLVRNAVQAAHSRVEVRTAESGDGVVFTVEDDGDGVAPEERDRIFEPFHTAGKGGRGTGLGLAIVKGVADEHRAEIRVSSSKRLGGSRFDLVLPGVVT